MGEFCTAKSKEGQRRPKSLYQNFRNRKFSIFPNLLLGHRGRWGIVGMVGRAETCSKHKATRPRAPLPHMYDVVAAEHGDYNEFQIPRNFGFLNLEIRKNSEFQNSQNS